MGILNLISKLAPPIKEEKRADLVSTPDSRAEAVRAKEDAHRAVEAAAEQQEHVTNLATSLEYQRDKNHFAEMINASMKGAG